MPTLDQTAADPFVKLMLIGDSGSGKTGSLASLVEAGYKLRIVDLDGGLQPLIQLLKAKNPALLSSVGFMSFRDQYKASKTGTVVAGQPDAYLNATKTMNEWEDGTSPSEWGSEYIYVVDSFTLLCRAAMAQAEYLKPTSNSGKQADGRAVYGMAQTAAENFLSCVTGPDFGTNVIIITHITDVELADGSSKGFPSAVGRALSRHIGKYFNDLLVVETKGTGESVRRVIRTVPHPNVDARTSALGLPKELPIDTGLATIFAKLRNN